MNEFLGIAIVGGFLTFVMQMIKAKWGPTSGKTRLITFVLAVVFGATYWLLKDTSIWVSILGILGVSQTVYNFFVKSNEDYRM